MSRRRRLILIAPMFLVAGLLIGILWCRYPTLSAREREILGKWAAPDPNPTSGYVTKKGAVTNPWRVWEFRRDRSYRLWIVSADDSAIAILDKEGRWFIAHGELHLEGFGTGGDALREMWQSVRVRFGGSHVGRTSGSVAHRIRFIDRDTWELTTPQGKPLVWNRRP